VKYQWAALRNSRIGQGDGEAEKSKNEQEPVPHFSSQKLAQE
jgi:hypothetical protein